MAQLIFAKSDEVREIVPQDGIKLTLQQMQEAVGGYIQIIRLKSGKFLLVDEEGLLKGKPVNIQASLLCGLRIVGDALLTNENEIE